MTQETWNTGVSGDWGTAADWVGGVPNSNTADATIAVAGTYTVTLAAATSDTVDSLDVSDSTANFDLLGTLDLGGTLATCTFDGSTFTLGSAGEVSGGTLDIDSGTLLNQGGVIATADFILGSAGEIALGGKTLTIGGTSTLDGTILGNGSAGSTLVVTGNAGIYANYTSYIENDATLVDAGTITETSNGYNLYLGITGNSTDSSSLIIKSGAVFDLAGGAGVSEAYGDGSIANAGLFESTYSGTNYAQGYFVNTGTILAAAGSDLALYRGGNLGGALTGAGEIDLYAGTYSLSPTLVVNVATLGFFGTVVLNGNLPYAGDFRSEGGELALNGHSITLSSASVLGDSATLAGAGTLKITGQDTLGSFNLTSGAVLEDAGTITQMNNLQLGLAAGDAATLQIDAGAVYDDQAQGGIDYNLYSGGNGSIVNAGLLEFTGYWNEQAATQLQANIKNTGTLLDLGNDLLFTGTLLNDGLVTLTGSLGLPSNSGVEGYVTVDGAISADPGKTGTIVIGADTYFDAAASVASQDIIFTSSGTAGSGLIIGELGSFAGTISSFAAGDGIDLVGVLANTFSYANNILTLEEVSNSGTAVVGSLALVGVTGTIGLVSDGHGGTEIILNNTGTSYSNPRNTTSQSDWSGTSAAWTIAADWSPAGEPGSLTTALFDTGGTYTVSYATTDSVYQLELQDTGGTFSMSSGKLTVEAGGVSYGSLALAGATLDIANGFSFEGQETQSGTGTLQVDNGAVDYNYGSFALAGAIVGSNDLGAVVFGEGANVTLNSGFALKGVWAEFYQNAAVTLGASLTLTAPMLFDGGSLDLNSHNLTLSGTTQFSDSYQVQGAGTLAVTGTAQLESVGFSGNANLVDAGTILQDGAIQFGVSNTDTSSILINSGAVYDMVDDANVYSIADGGTGSLKNAGLLELTGYGNDTETIDLPLINTGTILLAEGTLALAGGGTLGGTVIGGGELLLGGSLTLSNGMSIATAFAENGNLIDLNGYNLTLANQVPPLSGSVEGPGTLDILNALTGVALDNVFAMGAGATVYATFGSGAQFGVPGGNNAYLKGPGTFISSGSVLVADNGGGGDWDMFVGNGVNWDVAGTVNDAGVIGLGFASNPDMATISVAMTGVFDLVTDDAALRIYDGNSGYSYDLNNAGLLEKTGGTGDSYIQAYVVNTGTILATSGMLELQAGALGGVIGGGAGKVAMDGYLFNGAAGMSVTTTFGSGAQFGVAGGNNAYLNGPGTFISSGTVLVTDNGGGGDWDMFVGNGVNWDVAGTVNDAGIIGLGFASNPDTATISVATAGVFDLVTDDAALRIYDGNGGYSYDLNNAGLLEKTGGTGDSYIQAYVVNTGTVLASTGVLQLEGGISNDANGTLTGGAWEAAVSGTITGTLELLQDPTIIIDAADIILSGTGAEIITGASTPETIEASLVSISAAGTLQNLAGHTYSSSNTLTNAGAIILAGGLFEPVEVLNTGSISGYGTIGAAVQDTGTITASGGTLTFSGTVTGTGRLAALAGATVDLTTGGALTETISGAGTLKLDGATAYTLAGATIGIANVKVDSGATLSGHGGVTGRVTDAGKITASGGVLKLSGAVSGTGALTAAAGATVDLTAGGALSETISGAGTLKLDGATPYTLAGATIGIANVAVDSGATLSGNGSITGRVTDTGTVTASGGVLKLSGTVTGTGALTAAAGATVDLTAGGALTEAISGAGTLQLDAATYTLSGATLAVAAVAVDAGATLSGNGTVQGSVADAGAVSATGGTLTLGAVTGTGALTAASGATVDLTAGGALSEAISGAGTLKLDGVTAYTLAGATLGIAALTLDTGVTVSGHGSIASAVANSGTITASGGKLVLSGQISGSGVLQAATSSVLDLTAGETLNEAISGAGTLELSGTFLLGSGALSVSKVSIDAGALLSGAGTLTSIADAGTLAAAGGTLTVNGKISGAGTLSAGSGAVLNLAGGGSFGGNLGGTGTVDIAKALTLTTGAILSAATIDETAKVTLGASTALSLATGSALDITAGSGTTVELSGPSTASFTNNGSILGNGAGTAELDVAVINNANISVGSGTLSFLGTLTNDGIIDASAGSLSVKDKVVGTGALQIGATGTLSLLLGAGTGQTADFLAGTGLLDLTNPIDFKGVITGFGGSDVIDLLQAPETSYSFSNNVLTIKDGTTTEASLHFSSGYTLADFSVTSDMNGGTFVKFV